MPEVGRPVLVAVMGWGGPEDRLKSKATGFDEHLTKPVDISMIELLFATLAAREAIAQALRPWPMETPLIPQFRSFRWRTTAISGKTSPSASKCNLQSGTPLRASGENLPHCRF